MSLPAVSPVARALAVLLGLVVSAPGLAQDGADEAAEDYAPDTTEPAGSAEPAAASEAPPAAPAPAPAPADEGRVVPPCDPAAFPRKDAHFVGILADGGVCIDGVRVAGELDAAVRSSDEARPGLHWELTADPEVNDRHVAWVLRTIKVAGADPVIVDYAPVAPPPAGLRTAEAAAVAVAVAAEQGAFTVQPHVDFRGGVILPRVDGLGSGDSVPSGLRFGSQFLIAGAQADLGPYVSAKMALRAVERGGSTDVSFTTEGGDVGVISVPDSSDAHTVRPRDAWVSFRPTGTEVLDIRVGVQPGVFGSRDWFNHPVKGIYLIGPDQFPMVQVVGLNPARSQGIILRSELGKVGVDLGATNGDNIDVFETDVGKEVDLRLRFGGERGLKGSVSGKIDEVGPTTDGSKGFAWGAELRYQTDSLHLQGEVHGGEERATRDGQWVPYLGGQGAAQLRFAVPVDWLESGAVATRLGYHDPRSASVDADAFMLANGAFQGFWPTEGRSQVYSGLGYQVLVPMDITATVAHSALLQVGWFY